MAMAITVPRYTVEDLERFPDDGNRYELLDGVLLVTPGPGMPHQSIASRLQGQIWLAVERPGLGHVFGGGTIVSPPGTHLEPDLLVIPAGYPLDSKWVDIPEHWLAVEILSRSSRVYDREFKRDAYIALGVSEVWLVDRRDKSVEVSTRGGPGKVVRDTIVWTVPRVGLEVTIDLPDVFEGL